MIPATLNDGTRAALILTAELRRLGIITQGQREDIAARLLYADPAYEEPEEEG